MPSGSVPLRYWGLSAVLSVAADDEVRVEKAITRGPSDAARYLAAHGIDVDLLAAHLDAPKSTIGSITADHVPPPAVMLDAEDAVSPDPAHTTTALEAAGRWLTDDRWAPTTTRLVRLPGLDPASAQIVLARAEDHPPDAVVLPKVEDATAVARFRRAMHDQSDVGLILLIETARGVARVHEVADAAGDRLVGMMFGALDYAASTGLRDPREDGPLVEWARRSVANAAAGAGVPCIDGMTVSYPIADRTLPRARQRDQVLAGVVLAFDRARKAADIGMTGKLVGHPAQFLAAMLAFKAGFADEDVVGWVREARYYRRMLAGGQAIGIRDGQMVDRATYRSNMTRLRHAAAIGRLAPAIAAELGLTASDDVARHAREGGPL